MAGEAFNSTCMEAPGGWCYQFYFLSILPSLPPDESSRIKEKRCTFRVIFFFLSFDASPPNSSTEACPGTNANARRINLIGSSQMVPATKRVGMGIHHPLPLPHFSVRNSSCMIVTLPSFTSVLTPFGTI